MLQVPLLDAALLALADDPAGPSELRLEALRAALPRHREPTPAAFKLLIDRLTANDDPLATLAAGELAGQSRLDNPQRLRLLDAVRGRALITPSMLRAAFAPPVGPDAAARWVSYLEESLPPAGGPRMPSSGPYLTPFPIFPPHGARPCSRDGGERSRPEGPADRVRAAPDRRRPGPRPRRSLRPNGRVRDLSSRERRRRPGRPRPDPDRRRQIGPRPPGIDPLAELNLRPGLRAATPSRPPTVG